MRPCTLGLDYGTNSVRALIVDTATGEEAGTSVFDYPHGEAGILLDPSDPNVARQHPRDYLDGLVQASKGALADAARHGVSASDIIGIGVDTTGSTPLPLDADVMNRPLGISRSNQTCALGAAMAGSVVAVASGHDSFDAAAQAMTGVLDTRFTPDPARAAVYNKLFVLYRRLHDIFGTRDYAENQFDVMKSLLAIRDEARTQ